MISRGDKTLLAGVRPDQYVGRLDQIEQVYLHALSGADPFALRISAQPEAGTSEMLRQVYDRLFREQRFVVPFYFAVRSSDGTAESAAARYAYQFLLQAIAFRRKDPDLLSSSPDICELAKLAPLADTEWVDRMCEVCRNDGPLNDGRAFIRSALAAPLRAAAGSKMRVCVIIDDLHESAALDGGQTFLDEVLSLTANSRLPFILAARRRFAMPGYRVESVEIAPLSRDESAALVDSVAADTGINVSEQARDLISVQFGYNPFIIRKFLAAAKEKRRSLASFRDVERLYSEELLTGHVGDRFDDIFSRAAPDPGARQKLFELFHSALEPGSERFTLAALRDRLGVSQGDFDRLVDSLGLDEVIDVEANSAHLSTDDLLRDYLGSRYMLAIERKQAAAVAASTVTNALKRAPQVMARVYRRDAAVGLRDLMLGFDLQEIPRGLVDYRTFRDRFKGISDDEIRRQLTDAKDVIALPQISHAEPIADHLPRFAELIESERAIAGIGFTDRAYRDEHEVVWLAAEIDSKLEADYALTAEWCDRLDAAAAECGFSNYRLWLVAPEGFSDGALDLLSERNGIGSSRRQADLLRAFMKGGSESGQLPAAEYEIVIPIGEDTELIAAHALEDISRRYDFPAKTINQIKTALVEACINAAEHSLSPDRKIYQKFAIDNEKIVVTVSNRGIRLADRIHAKPAEEPETKEGRRGWGLDLMRSLMDEVRIESVDDGTRIVMTKYLKAR